MSDSDKGEILQKVAELPSPMKERALGFMQGLLAAQPAPETAADGDEMDGEVKSAGDDEQSKTS